jgi:hypothetical protein
MSQYPADADFQCTVNRLEAAPAEDNLSRAFASLTKNIVRKFPVTRGVLVVRDHKGLGLTALATWRAGSETRNLKLRLPDAESLFEKVAEDGRLFSENYCGCFSGNSLEGRMLLSKDSRSYFLQPLKHSGRVVGLYGFSSEDPDAFVTVEDGLLHELAEELIARITA